MLGNYYGYHGYGDFSGSVYDYHKLCCVITTAQGGGRQPMVFERTPKQMKEDGETTRDYRIRKITPLECWRLMSLAGDDDIYFFSAKYGSEEKARKILDEYKREHPEEYEQKNYRLLMEENKSEDKMSNTQLYKQAGNSICVNVICALLFNLLGD